jgi:hypothetical protein
MREEGKSQREIAEELGISTRSVERRFQRYFTKLAGRKNTEREIPNGQIPGRGRDITKVATRLNSAGQPVGYSVEERPERDETIHAHPLDKLKRVSTYYGANGEIIGQWQITVDDDARQKEAFDQIIEGFKEHIPRVLPSVRDTTSLNPRLRNLFILSDAHIGALAWPRETGDVWDLKTAEDVYVKALQAMVDQSPRANECLLVLLGDWTHYDKLEAVTTLSGHVLDSDGRQMKMNKVAIRIARALIDMTLKTHAKVNLLVAEGNHDIISSNWLRELFIVAYEMEPRLTVIDDPKPFYAVLQGDILHCIHHGHLKGAKKLRDAEALVAIFADEFRELWGKAKKVYVHTGHFHHAVEQEVRGALVTQHPTLAGRDSYAMRHGFGGLREARGSTYHEKWGRCGTVNVSPEMLEDL